MDISEFNIRGHNFISLDFNFRMKYESVLPSDKICANCGCLINRWGNVLSKKDSIYYNTDIYINRYELNCSEIVIKNILE